ncbi:uroporphyrinogen decarboxylase family protein [Mahella sp.]|uniref:uroporphyrinogen decarboxylase family protein n=1 Tax=Mahella sp. TaxID=2798721 RepID=UPI0025C0DE67|nr:uroporphyrinogen decarboxylase family protein [Mahella sp.]MBZ4666415.1 methylcobalamin:coenzyme methyltransferase [Mahella sp.]
MFDLSNYDFKKHNEEVKEVWDSYNKGNPLRVPMIIGTNTRYFIFNDGANPENISFKQYIEDPDVMFECQVRFSDWNRHHILYDQMMGLPEEGETWNVWADFQNFYEAAWFGCPIYYIEGNVPDTRPILDDNHKNMLFEKGIPDPFSGLMAKAKEYYEYFQDKAKTYNYKGIKAKVGGVSGLGTDGPMTVACNIRGATEFCMDLMLDSEYAHKLLSYITEATIRRIQAWRKYLGLEMYPKSWGFADDSISLLSCEMYEEFILPYHKRLCEGLSAPDAVRSIHLCGDASRHFPIIKQELNVYEFDTGFPIDLRQVARELGPKVRINGGPHVEFLRTADPETIKAKVQRIMESGVKNGGRFVLREGNNLAPHTPLENIAAMYEACKQYGRY